MARVDGWVAGEGSGAVWALCARTDALAPPSRVRAPTRQYNLFDAVRDKIVLLMQFDESRDSVPPEPRAPGAPPVAEEDAHPAVSMLIKNIDKIPVRAWVRSHAVPNLWP